MVRYSLILFAVVALFGCEQGDSDCSLESCGKLINKHKTATGVWGMEYFYLIERECDGSRFTKVAVNSAIYDRTYVGDHVCSNELE